MGTEKLGEQRHGRPSWRNSGKGLGAPCAAVSPPRQVLLSQPAPYPGAADKHPRGGQSLGTPRLGHQQPLPPPPTALPGPTAQPHKAQGLRRGGGWTERAGRVQRGPWPGRTGRWLSRLGGSEPHSEGHGGWGPGGNYGLCHGAQGPPHDQGPVCSRGAVRTRGLEDRCGDRAAGAPTWAGGTSGP